MEPTSRRQFLKRGSAVAAAAGVAAAVPASAAKALSSSRTNPDEKPLPNDSSVDIPVVAHVRDVRKGLVTLYTGEREITVKNRRLAAALYHATH
jgi:anaerobic selenocysteine-containing dehydrogenase